jgi:hypothetical protein
LHECALLLKVLKLHFQILKFWKYFILQTIRKRPSTFRFCMKGPLRFPNFYILRTWFCSLTPNYPTKVPPDLFYGEICWAKLSFLHSESEFVWKVPLGLQISNIWIRSFIPGPQINIQKCHQIYSTVKFVEQNLNFPILSRNLNGRYP